MNATSTPAVTNPNYFTLIHSAISVACLGFTLYASVILLFKRPKNAQVVSRTPIVQIYFWFTGTSSILLLINAGYILIWWRPNEILYHPLTLYYISGIPTIYVSFIYVADFFLCFDRCLLVAFPIKYRQKQRQLNACLFGLIIAGIFVSYILATNYFAFSPQDSRTLCVNYICLVLQLKYPLIIRYTKLVFCSLNLIAATYLLVLNFFQKTLQKFRREQRGNF